MNFFKQYDTWVMGRRTYEAIQNYDEESKKLLDNLKIRKIILTNNKNFHPEKGFETEHSIKEAISLGKDILICSGPTLNTDALAQGLVDMVMQYILPIEINDGIKPFNIETKNILKLVKEETTELGTITTYDVVK